MDKTGWTKVKLGDICNIHDKKRKPVSKTDRVDGEYPYYGANGIQSYIDGYLFDGDYILVGEDGSVITENGNPVVNLAHGKFWANNHVHVIDAKPCVDFNYLYQALQLADVSVFVHGNIPKLSQGDFKNIELYLPPMEIQLQIAKLLATIDDIIQSKSDESTKYQNMKTQIMNDIFNNGEREQHWTKVKVKDIFKITRGYVLKASETAEESDDEYRYPVYSSQTKNEGLMGYYNEFLYENAITWTTDGAYAGTVKYRKGKFYCTNVCGVLLSDKYANKCMAEILNMNTQPYVVRTGNPKLMNNVMAEIEIPLPPIEQQTLIANLLIMYDDMIDTVNKEKEDYEKIKTQMMNVIFA